MRNRKPGSFTKGREQSELEPGNYHEAVVAKVRLASACQAAVALLPSPTLDLAVPLVETDFQ
jgi:hypothetical protein